MIQEAEGRAREATEQLEQAQSASQAAEQRAAEVEGKVQALEADKAAQDTKVSLLLSVGSGKAPMWCQHYVQV